MIIPHSDSPGDPLHLGGKGHTLTWRGWLLIALGIVMIGAGLIWVRYQYVQSEAAQCDVRGRVCADLETD